LKDKDPSRAKVHQTLADIRYFEAVMNNEVADTRRRVGAVFENIDSPDLQLRAALDEVLGALGKLAARVRIVEQILASDVEGALASNRDRTIDTVDVPSLSASFVLSADAMDGIENIYELEFSGTGVPCRWTGPEPKTTFRLPIYRKEALKLIVGVVGVVKPSYLRELVFTIDGRKSKHRIKYESGTNYLVVDLPPSTADRVTNLALEVPKALSPLELGVSGDIRKLGVAISSIRAADPKEPIVAAD
jgi:hypothetical protein